jgi:NCAIR mutase (PurE)-related protein
MLHACRFRSLLTAVARGEINPETALDKLKHLAFEPVEDFAKIDHHRQLRTGFPEVIWSRVKPPLKSPKLSVYCVKIVPWSWPPALKQRIAVQLQEQVTDLVYYPLARICAIAAAAPENPQKG